MSKFEAYSSSKTLSNEEKRRVLLDTSLKGSALKGSSNFKTLDQIWAYLRRVHGNPQILLSKQVDKLRKLGKCSGAPLQRRDWFINLRDQLGNIHTLATEHGLLSALYSCDLIDRVYNLLPSHNLREHQKTLYEKGIGTDEESLFDELVTFVNELADQASFNADFALRNHCLEVLKQVQLHNSLIIPR